MYVITARLSAPTENSGEQVLERLPELLAHLALAAGIRLEHLRSRGERDQISLVLFQMADDLYQAEGDALRLLQDAVAHVELDGWAVTHCGADLITDIMNVLLPPPPDAYP